MSGEEWYSIYILSFVATPTILWISPTKHSSTFCIIVDIAKNIIADLLWKIHIYLLQKGSYRQKIYCRIFHNFVNFHYRIQPYISYETVEFNKNMIIEISKILWISSAESNHLSVTKLLNLTKM